jgi:sigma-B regulation protein RsbU (phosphoserine phosphatase)
MQSPSAAVSQLNTRITNHALTEQFFTLVYGILNQRSGEFRYAIAGHPAPLLVSRSGQLTHLPGSGLPIGIIETAYEEHSVQLEPGDRLFLFSDGVIEGMNSENELFGSTRFDESLRNSPERPLDLVLLQVLCDIKSWCGETPIHDDISLLALEFMPTTPKSERCTPTLNHSIVGPSVLAGLKNINQSAS